MLIRSAFIGIILFTTLNVAGQNKPVQFEDIKVLQAKEAKPVVILIMTEWCKYCHAMQNIMLKNAKVSRLLNDKFRTIFLDAEEKRDVFFAGRTFKYRSGIHELAQQLAVKNGQVSYPTICVLNGKNEIVFQHNGFLSAKAMEYTLKKIAENWQNE